jgi:hypothetical protein
MPHDECTRATTLDDEMDFVSIVPGLVVWRRPQHRQRARRSSNSLPHDAGDQFCLECELCRVRDMLPGTPPARVSLFSLWTEMAAARLHAVGRGAQYLDERGRYDPGTRCTQTDADALAWNREGDDHRTAPERADTVPVQVDRFDVDVGEVSHGIPGSGIRIRDPSFPQRSYLTSSSSTSNRSVAFGGMSFPAPRLPYPSCGGIISVRLPPTFMPPTP